MKIVKKLTNLYFEKRLVRKAFSKKSLNLCERSGFADSIFFQIMVAGRRFDVVATLRGGGLHRTRDNYTLKY